MYLWYVYYLCIYIYKFDLDIVCGCEYRNRCQQISIKIAAEHFYQYLTMPACLARCVLFFIDPSFVAALVFYFLDYPMKVSLPSSSYPTSASHLFFRCNRDDVITHGRARRQSN